VTLRTFLPCLATAWPGGARANISPGRWDYSMRQTQGRRFLLPPC